MVNWKLVSFVDRSKQRKELLSLTKKPVTPTELARKLNTHLTHVSRTLRMFKDKGLVECLTPDETMSKYYKITRLGLEVLEEIEKLKES